MKPRKPDRREERTREKAEAYFLIYAMMGDERTLKKVGDIVRSIGIKISDKTLERWSARYDWQAQLLHYQAEARARMQADSVQTTRAIVLVLEDMATSLLTDGPTGRGYPHAYPAFAQASPDPARR